MRPLTLWERIRGRFIWGQWPWRSRPFAMIVWYNKKKRQPHAIVIGKLKIIVRNY